MSPPMPRPRLVTIGASAPLSQSATLTTDPAAWEGPAAATAMTRAATGSESVFRRRRIFVPLVICDRARASHAVWRAGIEPTPAR